MLGEELVNASGKMMVLDRLLKELFKRKHKVLLFSQFTTMLDIIEVSAELFLFGSLLMSLNERRNGRLTTWVGGYVVLTAPPNLWIAEKK